MIIIIYITVSDWYYRFSVYLVMFQTMVIPENRDGKLENDPDLARESSDNAPVNTRKGGVQKQSSKTSRVRLIL